MRIEGFIQHPGAYPWYESMTLGDLVAKAGGLTVFAGRVRFARDGAIGTYQIAGPDDRLWSMPVRKGETVRVLHTETLEYNAY